MDNQTRKTAGTPKACPNKAQRYLFTIAPAGADLVLLTVIGVILWIV